MRLKQEAGRSYPAAYELLNSIPLSASSSMLHYFATVGRS